MKLLPLLLIVLAMFFGTPRSSCVCSETPVATTKSAAHSCCEPETQTHCNSDSHEICSGNACCGMKGKFMPGMANSLKILPNSNELVARAILPDWLSGMTFISPTEQIAPLNRAPPRLVGMGTSKTYLYKRTFLI